MNSQSAEYADKNIYLYAVVALIMAIKLAVSAAASIESNPHVALLETAELAILGLALALVAYLFFFHWSKLDQPMRENYLKGEGFVPQAFRYAVMQSFMISLALIVLVAPISTKISPVFTGAFYLNAAAAVMLAILAISFFVRVPSE